MSTLKPTIDLGYPTKAIGSFPSFNSLEEEAEWWDTHDAEGDPVEIELIALLGSADLAALNKYARKQGTNPTTLASMWIKEHLAEEAARKAKVS